MLPQSEKPTRLPSSECTLIVLGDLLTVNAYDMSERTFNVLGVLLTVNTYDNSERTFIVLGDLVDRQHFRHQSAPSTCSASC